jgi:hypothetical protein
LTVQTLNEDQMLAELTAAIQKGDAAEITKLMSAEHTELKNEAPVTEEVAVDEAVEKQEVEETKAADEPEVKEDTKPDTSAEVKDDKPKPKDGLPEWVAALPEEVKDKVLNDFQALIGKAQYLEQYQRSNEGRVSALQKKADKLERELETRKATPPPKTEAAPTPLKLDDSPKLAKLKEEDPALYEIQKEREEEILKHAQKLVDQAQAEVKSTLEKQLAPVHKQQEAAYIREQQENVLSVVPNAVEVVNSPAWDAFEKTASPAVQKLINSAEGDDIIAAFQIYDNWLRQNYPDVYVPAKKEEVQTRAETTTPVVDTKQTETANKTAEERQRKLKAGAVTQKGEVVVNAISDPEAALEDIFQKLWKEKGFDRYNSVRK